MNFKDITFGLFVILLLQFFDNTSYSKNNSYIVLKIDNKIITNIDIENEKKYLLDINEKLSTLTDNQIFDVAKDSLIREKIKKNELEKYYDTDVFYQNIDNLIKDFYKRLNFKDLNELEQYLLSKGLTIETVKHKLNIEALWNQGIYSRYGKQVEIDENKLKEKIKDISYQKQKESVSISEIVFSATNKSEIKDIHNKIINSIATIGFNNTANIYSLSETAKFGGEIGWVNTSQLSKNVNDKIKKIEIGEYTDLINIPGGFLILKIIDKKIELIEINPEEELKQMISYEKDRQLNEFSSIYFQKVKKNSLIDEK